MSENLNVLLKEYSIKQDYYSYNNLVKDEIINFLVKKIKLKNPKYIYTDINGLSDVGKTQLNHDEYYCLQRMCSLDKSYEDNEYISDDLIDLYNNLLNSNNIKFNKYAEVAEALNILGNSYKDKLPEEILNFFDQELLKEKNQIIINTKCLNLSKEAITILSYLSLKYWIKDDDKNAQLKQQYIKNEMEFQNKVLKYKDTDWLSNTNNNQLSKDKNREDLNNVNEVNVNLKNANIENKDLVEIKKETFLQKILNFCKKFFKK